jgi:hypothetical protein
MAGTRRDSNQELIGQGIANLIVPLFSGFAATGALRAPPPTSATVPPVRWPAW